MLIVRPKRLIQIGLNYGPIGLLPKTIIMNKEITSLRIAEKMPFPVIYTTNVDGGYPNGGQLKISVVGYNPSMHCPTLRSET